MKMKKGTTLKFRAGIVGCGRIGSETDDDPKRMMVRSHAGAYRAVDETELTAVCDSDRNKLEKCGKKWGVPSLYVDYKEMLKKEDFDILSICTWSSSHLEIAKEAIKNGVKAIFCEKPIANSLNSANEMVRLCNKNNVILQIDHQRRFNKFHQDLRGYIKGGKLGEIQQVTFYYGAGIANTGTHVFDLLRFFFGEVRWVQGVYSRNGSPNPNDPNIDGWLKFESGLMASVQALDSRFFSLFEMDCIGTNGRLNLTHGGFGIEFYEPMESEIFSGYKELFVSRVPFRLNAPFEFITSGLEHLVGCMKSGQESISSGEDGLRDLEIICAMHESALDKGRRKSLPLKDSPVVINSR
jgi:predicted dehydrogenase